MSKGKLATALLVAGLFCLHQAGSQDMLLTGAGKPPGGGGGGGGYQGPGNIVSFRAWWGFRGYNTADTADVADVCLPSDTLCAHITLTAGSPVIPGSLSTCNNSTVFCTVKTLYDKSGANQCSAAPCHLTEATEGIRPLLRLSATPNGLPCADNAGLGNTASAAITSIAQPFSTSWVALLTGTANYRAVFGDTGSSVFTGHDVTSNNALGYTGGSVTMISAITDSAFNAVQMQFDSTASVVSVNGSNTTGLDVGNTTGFSGTITTVVPSFNWVGYVCEAGIGAGKWTTGNNSSLAAQQQAFWMIP